MAGFACPYSFLKPRRKFLYIFLYNNICMCKNGVGLALLRLRERVVSDPFGALSNWKENGGEIDPCSWFGVECSDRKVVSL